MGKAERRRRSTYRICLNALPPIHECLVYHRKSLGGLLCPNSKTEIRLKRSQERLMTGCHGCSRVKSKSPAFGEFTGDDHLLQQSIRASAWISRSRSAARPWAKIYPIGSLVCPTRLWVDSRSPSFWCILHWKLGSQAPTARIYGSGVSSDRVPRKSGTSRS